MKRTYTKVGEQHGCFNDDTYGFGSYDYPNGLAKQVHNYIDDICVIGKNLGFGVYTSSMTFLWKPGKEQTFWYNNGKEDKIFMKVRAYKKGTVHIKASVDFMKAFNIEASRLNGWVKSSQELNKETSIDESSSKKYFGANCQINMSNVKLLN